MKKISVAAIALLLTVSAVSLSHAVVGVGIHYGVDLSMSMDNVDREAVNLSFNSPYITGDLSPFYVSRLNWKSSPVNFGAKFYVDIIPVINAVELSCNFGMWQYDGSLHYLDINASEEATTVAGTPTAVYADELPLTLDATGLSYVGLSGTPYAKLHFDASVRKTLLDIPAFKFSVGGGLSAHFATPLLSSKLIESALSGMPINSVFMEDLADPDGAVAADVARKIVKKVVDEAFGKPVMGMHLLVGANAKLPAIPVGVYVDGKLMVPFSNFDKDAGKGVEGLGFLLNMGLSMSI